jgi:hypothetical protein
LAEARRRAQRTRHGRALTDRDGCNPALSEPANRYARGEVLGALLGVPKGRLTLDGVGDTPPPSAANAGEVFGSPLRAAGSRRDPAGGMNGAFRAPPLAAMLLLLCHVRVTRVCSDVFGHRVCSLSARNDSSVR